MLFLDTSALLAMLGGNSATPTAFKLSLLQVRHLAILGALTSSNARPWQKYMFVCTVASGL
jgi:hypothetical protein